MAPTTAFQSDGTNTMSSANLRPGDIILLGSDGTLADVIPCKWSHTVVFGGVTTDSGQVWATEEGEYMDAGEAWVIHSTMLDSALASGRPSWDDDSGLRTSRFTTVVNGHADNVVALRVVKPGGVTLTTSEENALLAFCTSRLTQQNAYDYNWLYQQVEIDSVWPAPAGYYCSELAWAMVKSVLGIDLDGNWSPFDVGVSPEDLYWAEHTGVIALEMNSDPSDGGVPGGDYRVDASTDLYKITVFIDEVYYDNDYDGNVWFVKDDGEEYLRGYVGEAYFPSCFSSGQVATSNMDKIDDMASEYITRRDAGAVNWDNYHSALVSYDSYAKIRIEAWEADGGLRGDDDQYPVWQWWWNPSQWHAYIGAGWIDGGYRVDLGDCRYTIDFRIDPVSFPSLPISVMEDAEDGDTSLWQVYDNSPVGTISNVADGGDRAIQLSGGGTGTGYRYPSSGNYWNALNVESITWSQKYSESYTVYVSCDTTAGHRYIYYTAADSDSLGTAGYVHHGLGSGTTDGQWHTFTRDLQADLHEAQPTVDIIDVNAILFRGSGLIDDIMLQIA